jgi:hypothetical protein
MTLVQSLKDKMGESRFDQWATQHFPHINSIHMQHINAFIYEEIIQEEIEQKIFLEVMIQNIKQDELDQLRMIENIEGNFERVLKLQSNVTINPSLSGKDSVVLQKKEFLKELVIQLNTQLAVIEKRITEIDSMLTIIKPILSQLNILRTKQIEKVLNATKLIINSHPDLSHADKMNIESQIHHIRANQEGLISHLLSGLHTSLETVTQAAMHSMTVKPIRVLDALLAHKNEINIASTLIAHTHDYIQLDFELNKAKKVFSSQSDGIQTFIKGINKTMSDPTSKFDIPVLNKDTISVSGNYVKTLGSELDRLSSVSCKNVFNFQLTSDIGMNSLSFNKLEDNISSPTVSLKTGR